MRRIACLFVASLAFAACPPAATPDVGAAAGRIAFASNRAGNFDIYTMSADGKAVTRLTTSPAADFEPTWSPDGARIAFLSQRGLPHSLVKDGYSRLYVMRATGGPERLLTPG